MKNSEVKAAGQRAVLLSDLNPVGQKTPSSPERFI